MSGVEVKKRSRTRRILIRGDATIESIGAITADLKAIPPGRRSVVLDLSQMGGADLSFIQLICSLHKELIKEGSSLHLEGVPAQFRGFLGSVGIGLSAYCDLSHDTECVIHGRE